MLVQAAGFSNSFTNEIFDLDSGHTFLIGSHTSPQFLRVTFGEKYSRTNVQHTNFAFVEKQSKYKFLNAVEKCACESLE